MSETTEISEQDSLTQDRSYRKSVYDRTKQLLSAYEEDEESIILSSFVLGLGHYKVTDGTTSEHDYQEVFESLYNYAAKEKKEDVVKSAILGGIDESFEYADTQLMFNKIYDTIMCLMEHETKDKETLHIDFIPILRNFKHAVWDRVKYYRDIYPNYDLWLDNCEKRMMKEYQYSFMYR
jgi:hypothetical protein